jgi:caa(3)-type oxidase subunit IV
MSHGDAAHPRTNYVKVWGILLALMALSLMPEFAKLAGIHMGTAITIFLAFGVAFVKAYLVAVKFMHITHEPKYVTYFVMVCLGFMVVMFAGVAPDVLRHDGLRWSNVAAKDFIRKAEAAQAAGGGHGQEH